MVDIVTKLLLLFSPIVYSVGVSLKHFDLRFFEIGVIGLFAASLLDKPKRELGRFSMYLVLFLGLLIVNSMVNKYQPMDIRAVESVFFGILAFVILVRYLNDCKSCYQYMLWALAINIVVLGLQHIGYAPILDAEYGGSKGGMMANIEEFGIYLALVMPYLPFIAMLILAGVFGLVWPYPQLSIYIPLLIVAFFRYHKFFQRILMLVCIAAPLALFHGRIVKSLAVRWEIWKPTIDMFFERPLLGWGLGTYYIWNGTETFSLYIPLAYGVGFLGLVWIGFLFYDVVRNFRPDREILAALSLFMLSLIEYPFDISRLWFTIAAILAFYAINQIKKTQEVIL